MAHHRIVSMEVDDGFLEGTKVTFAGHLTCVIGSRGSGKTTLLEFIRYALNHPQGEPIPQKKMLEKNLKPGRLRLLVEDAAGGRFVVERLFNDAPRVFDSNGRAIVDGWKDLFDVDYFTQTEIAAIADDPLRQLQLVDSFVAQDLADLASRLQTLERTLEHQIDGVKTSGKSGVELAEVDGQIEANARRLGELAPPDAALDAAKRAAIAAQVRRQREATLLNTLVARLRESQLRIVEAKAFVLGKLDVPFDADLLADENGPILRPLADGLAALVTATQTAFADVERGLRAQQATATAAQAQLADVHLQQNVAGDAVLQRDGQARERLELEKGQDVLRARRDQLRSDLDSRTAMLAERARLVDELVQVVDRRTAIRRRQVVRLNGDLETFGVRFVLQEGADVSAYQERLEDAFKGSGKHGQRDIVLKLLTLEPRKLGKHVMAGARAPLVKDCRLDDDQASWVLTHLRDHDDLLTIQATTSDDRVQVEFNVNGTWKPTQSLSTGQKCSAILPILMLQDERPLVADEPESHLDQRTLVDRLVVQLQRMRGARQLIVATHNPNIVTLADAGDTAVVVLTGDGARATVAQGSVDDMRREIETLLEGGKEAFRKRGELYAKS